MNRRRFLQESALGLGAALGSSLWRCERGPNDQDEESFYLALVAANDRLVLEFLKRQVTDPGHPMRGGMADRYGLFSAGLAARLIQVLACALAAPESRFHGSPWLAERMHLAARFLLRVQHEDGTIDLPTTNFHSPPDTAFVLEPLCGVYEILPETEKVKKDLQTFILKAAGALVVGGIHTPNHRWVVCRALARANSLFPNPGYIKRIDRWLMEKIDIDPDGQFTEKSTAIYSPLTDHCLITMARKLGRPELYDPVRRNLEMTLYYVHPDGEVATEASKRQDQYKKGSMARYYYPYRYMALLDGDGRFATMARWIERTAGPRLTGDLMYLLEDSSLGREMPPNLPVPDNYVKHFSHSNLVRIRRGDVSATILAKNPIFFSMRKGRAVLEGVRFASAFFGKGQFEAESLSVENGAFILRQKLEGPYYQPFPRDKLPDDGDWEKMDKELRPKSEIQHLESTVTVKETNGAFRIKIEIEGTDGVPVAVELGFRHGGRLGGVEKVKDVPNAYLLREGFGRYSVRDDTITFGPGCAAHRWTQLRGAKEKMDARCVYLTGLTPFRITLKIS